MSEPVGYCAIIVPKHDFWQAMFIMREYDKAASDVAKAAEVIEKLADANDGQPVRAVGIIAAAATTAIMAHDEYTVGATTAALRKAIRADYFYIIGEPAEHGMLTQTHVMGNVHTVDEARNHINNLPIVMEIKDRLLKKATEEFINAARR